MRTLLLLYVLMASLNSAAQDTIQHKTNTEHFRLYYVLPKGIGNNVLAKANDGVAGVGLFATLYSIEKLHFVAGFEFSQYNVTDVSLAANVTNTYLSNIYFGALYKIPLVNKVDLTTKFTVGAFTVNQRTGGSKYGKQNGPAFTPGFDVDLKIVGQFRIFAGLDYCLALPSTHTAKEYKSFYGTLHQLNITTGIKF
jgi:hypothetical protein